MVFKRCDDVWLLSINISEETAPFG